jgi:hypothetical protein
MNDSSSNATNAPPAGRQSTRPCRSSVRAKIHTLDRRDSSKRAGILREAIRKAAQCCAGSKRTQRSFLSARPQDRPTCLIRQAPLDEESCTLGSSRWWDNGASKGGGSRTTSDQECRYPASPEVRCGDLGKQLGRPFDDRASATLWTTSSSTWTQTCGSVGPCVKSIVARTSPGCRRDSP